MVEPVGGVFRYIVKQVVKLPPAQVTKTPTRAASNPTAPSKCPVAEIDSSSLLRRAGALGAAGSPYPLFLRGLENAAGYRAVDRLRPAIQARKNPGSSKDSVQRKVGFEFETAIPVYANGRNIIAKGAKLFEGETGDWYGTPDAGNLELVTEPFEEEGDNPELYELISAISDLRIFVRTLLAFNEGDEQRIYFKDVRRGHANQHQGHDVYVLKDSDMEGQSSAAPQVTGGVSLENIPKLFEASLKTPILGGATSMANNQDHIGLVLGMGDQLAKDYIKAAQGKMVENPKKPYQLDKLRGLMALIYAYLIAGEEQQEIHDQAKYAFPLMSRMDFLSMFTSLNETTKELFIPDLIFDNAGMLERAFPVYSRGFLDPLDKDRALQEMAEEEFTTNFLFLLRFSGLHDNISAQFGQGVSEYISENNVTTVNVMDHKEEIVRLIRKKLDSVNKYKVKPEQGPKRLDWITQLQKGATDLMSSAPVTSGMAASSPAMGKQKALDVGQSGLTPELVQIELRRLAKGVPLDDWLGLSMNLFRMFRAVQRKQD